MTSTPEDDVRDSLNARSRALWPILLAGAVVLLVVAVVVAALRFTDADERPTGDIASSIKDWADDRGAGGVDVDCPDPIEWKVGETFRCIMSKGKRSLRVTVTMENDEGDVTWVVR